MKKFDDGGPVYPCCEITSWDEKGWTKVNEHPGITRRDECADRLAAALLSNPIAADELAVEAKKEGEFVSDTLAKFAYMVTDSLIAYGKKK